MVPTACRLVLYTLSAQDAQRITGRRKAGLLHAMENALTHFLGMHEGNAVSEGDEYPLLITRMWGDSETSCFNGTVFLDGGDTLWVTSTSIGEGPGKCRWPLPVPLVPQQVVQPPAGATVASNASIGMTGVAQQVPPSAQQNVTPAQPGAGTTLSEPSGSRTDAATGDPVAPAAGNNIEAPVTGDDPVAPQAT